MRFRCERDVLGEALATAARAAQGRAGSQPVLAGVRLVLQGSRLEITGTDLELTIQKTIEVNGEQDGACVVPGRLTSEAVRTPWSEFWRKFRTSRPTGRRSPCGPSPWTTSLAWPSRRPRA